MRRIVTFRLLWPVAPAALLVAALACNLSTGGGGGGGLTVEITSPESGSSVPLNQPVSISCAASDPGGPGVARVEVLVNGEVVASEEPPGGPQASFAVETLWTPTAGGRTVITAIAYRQDGTASEPASVVLTVEGEGSGESSPQEGEQPAGEEAQVAVQGRVTTRANIRSGPGPLCPIIGFADKDTVINLLEYSRDQLWFKTDYPGEDQIGWIYTGVVTPLGDTSLIPISDAVGCAGCGDGVCEEGESCYACPEDCGECCGNGVCEPDYGEDCATCEADCGPCCGNGVCEADRGEDCTTCEEDCGPCPPVCGNGVVEAGEQCEQDADCGGSLERCVDCVCVYVAPVCGNGIVEPGEECEQDSDCGEGYWCDATHCICREIVY